jgi:glycosyltransferase involved in cell wall biosynthesis
VAHSSPLVTVVIPAFNAERYLLEAVRSVQSQVYRRLEIIIVNDGSTDKTSDLATECACNDPRVRVISQPNAGPSSARNMGLRSALGDYVSFLDSDDALHPMKIARQVIALESTRAGLVYCDYCVTDENLVPVIISETRPKLPDVSAQLPLQNVFPPHAALVRREVINRVGYFDESLSSAEDWDYWIRCAGATVMTHVPGALCFYRRHGDQIHNDRQLLRSSQRRVIHKHYGRGTLSRRMAMAGFHWGEAKYSYGRRRWARMLLQCFRVVALTRNPAKTLQVIRISGYG